MDKKLIIFIDSGDTLVDESTEIYNEEGNIVLSADLREGAARLIKTLKDQGFKVYMVADGLKESFLNVHKYHGIYDDFDGHIFSGDVGCCKPERKMFDVALDVAGLDEKECYRVMMIGNNLERDIVGANRMGIISVQIDWSPRYPKEPSNQEERPDYIITEPMELVDLANEINTKL